MALMMRPSEMFAMENAAPNKSAPRSRTEVEDRAPDTSGLRRMLNIEQVLAVIPLSQVTIWRLERKGRFPKGSYISPNRKIWYEDEIVAWQNEVNGRGRGRRHHPIRSKSTTT
jgi:prophage regulatory protein